MYIINFLFKWNLGHQTLVYIYLELYLLFFIVVLGEVHWDNYKSSYDISNKSHLNSPSSPLSFISSSSPFLEQFQQVSFFHLHACVHSVCTIFALLVCLSSLLMYIDFFYLLWLTFAWNLLCPIWVKLLHLVLTSVFLVYLFSTLYFWSLFVHVFNPVNQFISFYWKVKTIYI
jgi:hypothetical protein